MCGAPLAVKAADDLIAQARPGELRPHQVDACNRGIDGRSGLDELTIDRVLDAEQNGFARWNRRSENGQRR